MDGELKDIIKCSFIDLTCSLHGSIQQRWNYTFLVVSIQRN